MTARYTMPPVKTRPFGVHLQASNSINSTRVRINKAVCESITTTSLQNTDGKNFIEDDYLLFDEIASRPTPTSGFGRIWLKKDTPNRLFFTNSAGVNVPLSPGIDNALEYENDANATGITNLTNLNFTSAILVGNETASSTGSTTSIAIGQGASATGTQTLSLGYNADSNLTQAVAVGRNTSVNNGGSSANGPGGVAVGFGAATTGPGVSIGRNVANTSTDQDTFPNILIGRNITASGTMSGAIAIGADAVPGHADVTFGNAAASLGSQEHVIIGGSAGAGSLASVAIGEGSHAAIDGDLSSTASGHAIAVGRNSSATFANGIALGYNSASSATNSIAFGAHAVASGSGALAIGGGTTAGSGATAAADGAIAIGSKTNAAHENSVCLGYQCESRIANEIVIPGLRIVKTFVTTVNATPTVALLYPTVTDEILIGEVVVFGYRASNETSWMGRHKILHFRNKGGVLTIATIIKSGFFESQLQVDNTDISAYTMLVDTSDTNIRVTVTGAAGHTTTWTCILKLYASPLV